MFEDHEYNVVLQKEYVIIQSDDSRPVLATDTVRGCYAVMLYHATKSAILHFDDNSCRADLDHFLTEFLSYGELRVFTDCRVHLVGGWSDHKSSSSTGQFLKEYFTTRGFGVDLTYFQMKKENVDHIIGELPKYREQGFCWVAMSAVTGEAQVSDDWGPFLRNPFDGKKYWGVVKPWERDRNRACVERMLLQVDNDVTSGAHIYSRDSFASLLDVQSRNMCVAARNGDRATLIRTIETGITSVDTPPSGAKGWTPLHYACKLGHFKVARCLIYCGADLDRVNDKDRTPWSLVQDKTTDEAKGLRLAFDLLKLNMDSAPTALWTYSLFGRKKTKSLCVDEVAMLKHVKTKLKTEAGREELTMSAGFVKA